MFEDEDAKTKTPVVLGEDLSSLSVGDIDERIAQFETEIVRLKEERGRKSSSIDAAEAFFKKPG